MKGVLFAALALALLSARAAWAEEKKPSDKAKEAVANLKGDLAAFEVHVYSFPSPAKGDDLIRLVTDAKKVPAKSTNVFAIAEKQAAAAIDYLAENGWFDRVHVPPPGFPVLGWYVAVSRGPADRKKVYYWYSWVHGFDVKPDTVGVIQHLTKALDGDAKAAIQNFRKDAPKK